MEFEAPADQRGKRCFCFVCLLARVCLMALVSLSLACDHPVEEARQLILISVDTLRADHLGAYGQPLALTPNIDVLAEASTVFTWAYAPSSYTLPSVSALLTGRYPEEVGVTTNRHVLAQGVPTLATILLERGWRTGAVVSNFVLGPAVGVDRGFELFDASLPQREAARPVPERIAKHTTDAALKMLDVLSGEGQERVFLWVHYQDPHGAYTPPPGYRERYLAHERTAPDGRRRLKRARGYLSVGRIPEYQFVEEQHEVAFYRAGYDGEIRYLDEEIGRLLRAVDRHRPADETILVFTADHGEALGEADFWFAHGEYLIQPLVHVPLMLRLPTQLPQLRTDVASLLDVLPTLAQALGFPPPPGVRGRDLFAGGAEREASDVYLALPRHSSLPRFGLIADDYHYLVELEDGQRREQLFRLGNDSDLAHLDTKRLQIMRQQLQRIRASVGQRSVQVQNLSPEDRRRLEALGYLGDP